MEFEMIAKTFQGLEGVLAQELTALGANNIEQGRRMVSFTGDKEMLYRANFSLRTAVRILKPIKHFRAKTADEVYDAVKQIDWSQYLSVNTSVAVDSVVYSNEFRHSRFVAYKVKDGAMCGLGQTAPNPVLTTIKYFRNEYEDHIYNKKCTAASCKSLISFNITDECRGCTACARKCPVGAISGNKKEKHFIDQDVCIRCGRCEENCKFDAIVRE